MFKTIFEVLPFGAGYYITINHSNPLCIHNDGDYIRLYLQVDINNFNDTLKLYNGVCECFFRMFKYKILYFTNRKNAELFVSEYLEPLLTARELSVQ